MDNQVLVQKEQDHKTENGGEMRITYLHPELFAQTKMMWFYNCVPIPSSSDPLSYMVFAKAVQDAIAIFGPESLNVKRLKHRFASLTGHSYDQWFISEQEMQNNAAQAAASGQPAQGGTPAQKPSVPGKPTAAGPSIASVVAGGKPTASLASVMR